MKAGSFNINDYLIKLQENAESGNITANQQMGLIIPEENQKSFSWLKREYDKGKVEVKVEIKMGGSKFEPGYNMQSTSKGINDFKPGMYGEIKTSDTPVAIKEKNNAKKEIPKEDGEKESPAEKKAEKSTGNKEPKKLEISARVKTADEIEGKPTKAIKKDVKS